MYFRLTYSTIILLGLSIAISGYIFDRSLWLDEAFLGINLIERNYLELFYSLDHNQVAPILFLLLEKLLSECFNYSDYALRAIPFASFMACMVLTYIVSKQLIPNSHAPILAVCLISLSPIFLSYAHEIKPYMSDAFTTLLLLYISLRLKLTTRWLFVLATTGVIAVFFSNTSTIILSTIGIYLLSHHYKNAVSILKILLVISAWLVAFGVNYFFLLQNNLGSEYLQNYWVNAFFRIDILDPYAWLNSCTYALKTIGRVVFGYPLHYWTWKIFAIFFCISIFFLIRTQPLFVSCLLYVPLVIHIVLACFGLYPFATRLLLYQAPLIIIGLSFGIAHISQYLRVPLLSRIASFCLVLPLIPLHLYSLPIRDGGILPAILKLEQHAHHGDTVYVYHSSRWEYKFYSSTRKTLHNYKIIYGSKEDSNHSPHNVLTCSTGDRLWAIFSGVNSSNMSEQNDYNSMTDYFRALSKTVYTNIFPGSSLYLFTLDPNIYLSPKCQD